MAGTPTIADAKERLANYLLAEAKILKGQSYQIKDRTLTRADLRWVQNEIRRLQAEVTRLEGGGMRVKRGVPRDT
jgi:hypothetical protein